MCRGVENESLAGDLLRISKPRTQDKIEFATNFRTDKVWVHLVYAGYALHERAQ